MAIGGFADLWRDQGSNLALIELAQDPKPAGKKSGWDEPAVNGRGRTAGMKGVWKDYTRICCNNIERVCSISWGHK